MRLVIIGGEAAGLSAAARARRVDPRLEIVVFEKGGTISYAACGLPYYVEGRVRNLDELVVYTPEYFRRERNITVRTGAEVSAIAHARRQVVLAGGERVAYDRLVIATGARAAGAAVPGAELEHVFTLRTLEDATRIREFLQVRRPRRAAVVGAGYLGLELVEVLRANGLAVTLLEASGTVLRRHDAALLKRLLPHLERFGVAFRPNEPLRAITPERVNDTPAELVILATGFRPNVELAEDAGVELGRTGAIRVTERMETNLHGVYAAGDCAEVLHRLTGRAAYIPLGTTANKMGRVAGANAAGRRERFPGVVGTSIVRVCGLGIGLTGLSERQARGEGRIGGGSPKPAPAWGPGDGRAGRRRTGQRHRRRFAGGRPGGGIRTVRPGLLSPLRHGVGSAAHRRPAACQAARLSERAGRPRFLARGAGRRLRLVTPHAPAAIT